MSNKQTMMPIIVIAVIITMVSAAFVTKSFTSTAFAQNPKNMKDPRCAKGTQGGGNPHDLPGFGPEVTGNPHDKEFGFNIGNPHDACVGS